MSDSVIRSLLDAMTVSVGVPFQSVTDAPLDARRAAIQALATAHTPIESIQIDDQHFLGLRYDDRLGSVVLAGPYRKSPDPTSGDDAITTDTEERVLRALTAIAPGLRDIANEHRQRLELATQLEVSTSSVLAVTGELALDTVLRRIVDLSRQLAGAKYAALGVPDDSRRLVAFITSGMTDEQERRIGELPRGRGILGLLLEEPKTIRLRELGEHPASVGFPPRHPPMNSFLGVPIIAHGRVLGNLYLTDKLAEEEFSVRDERLVEILALHAAVAIENARLYQTVEREQHRLRAVLEQLPEAVMIVERDPEIVTLVNGQTSQLLGWRIETPMPLADYVAMNTRETSDGDPISDDDLPIVRAVRHGESTHLRDVLITRPDGSQITVLLNAAPTLGSEGSIIGAIAVFQDVTLIRDAEQLKDDFLSIVSHELRTPLTTIRGGATMLLRDSGRLDAETRDEILGDISNESNRLAILVENMVQLAHIRAGRLAMETEPVHVLGAIRSAVNAEQQQLASRKCTMTSSPDLVVAADPRSLDQIIRNLLHNAVKYSPPESPIEVSATRDDQLKMAAISVRDHGIGIDEKDVPHVFERFRRASAVESSQIPGMGLGLYLCRELVEALDGKIWIESPPDGGTIVAFSLPVAADD
ncbi:MAG TPA: ATP-binding protein [Thermomicrobiales bacterium]|nr:ATP-binding protein [Thermomicrobiales bacterium]